MQKNLKVVIADDNAELAGEIKSYLDSQSGCTVQGIAENAREAAEMVRLFEPDAVILDLIMPGSDGFSLLERMSTGEFGKMPVTIVLSALRQESIISRVLSMGAHYYMVKPVDTELLYKRLIDLTELKTPLSGGMIPAARTRSLDERITSIFLSVGIPAHIKGYQFLREGIRMVIARPECIGSITKVLYPGIAERFDTSASKVERAIRHAIEVAWTRGRIENINDIFGYNIYSKNDKPTNGEFIALIADRLLMEEQSREQAV